MRLKTRVHSILLAGTKINSLSRFTNLNCTYNYIMCEYSLLYILAWFLSFTLTVHVCMYTGSPSPSGLQVANQSQGVVTFTWDQPMDNCFDLEYTYHVATTDCGSCLRNMNTTDNSVTCRGLIPGQRCSISVRAIDSCAVSLPVTTTHDEPNIPFTSASTEGIFVRLSLPLLSSQKWPDLEF